MEDFKKNTAISFQEENNVNSPDKTNSIKELVNDNIKGEPIPITTQNDLKKNLFTINRNIRYCIYIMELLCLLNFDQGALSASTKEIKYSFKMTDTELGSFGGISFFGTTLGGIFSLSTINKINRRYLILSLLIISICSLFIPTIISSKLLFIFCRILTGFSQAFMSIYLPVWVDQFGIYNKRSIMISLISLPSAFGYLLGNVFVVYSSWKTTFRINVFLCSSLFVGFLLNKDLYFSKSIIPKKRFNLSSENINNSTNNDNINNIDEISLFEDDAINNTNYDNQSIIKNAIQCFKSPLFRYILIAIISIFFIVSGLQFWVNNFFENSLDITDKKSRLTYFIVIIVFTALVAPITGGLIMQKLGGYDSKRVMYLPFICCIISLICSNLMLLSNNKYYILILLEGYLFSGCIIIPSLNGILISSMSKELAGSVSAISNLLYNVLGRLAGPSFYGFARSLFDIKSKLPMILLFDVKFITAFCIFQSFKYKK